MKKFICLLFIILSIISCSKDEQYGDDGVFHRTYRYQIVNNTNKDIDFIAFYSYKDKSRLSDSDKELMTSVLKIGETTKEFKTKYSFVNFNFLYYIDSWVSESPILKPGEFPSKNTFYELKKDELNIIEIKSVY